MAIAEKVFFHCLSSVLFSCYRAKIRGDYFYAGGLNNDNDDESKDGH
ncbi:Predicted protein [Anoxybacillus flavithermus WK1]|uniref:Lipoprotein n=1 Tax=Anoxybacillus flavithermus (strain DSM 21510 / WK1) TaxID=491915 RepID=B7GJM4_ANOFW|nr:Predicted protein [Anoxybacillus flavithermus WK1]